jgi:hypothetical protein
MNYTNLENTKINMKNLTHNELRFTVITIIRILIGPNASIFLGDFIVFSSADMRSAGQLKPLCYNVAM